jgi:DNA-binding CsgD family transcriptional regulator
MTADALAEISRQLRVVVPFSASFWAGSDPLTSLATAPALVENIDDGRQCQRFWEREFLVQDFNLFRDLARADRPVASLYRTTAGQPTRSQRFRELHADLGFGDELRAVFRSGGSTWGVVTLFRDQEQPSFSAADEKLVNDLSVPITEAFRRAAFMRAAAAPESPEAPGLLVFNRDGVLRSVNDHAERWLNELPVTGGVRTASVDIPNAVRTVLGLAHGIASGFERGAARARVQGRSGRWLLVHGFALRGESDIEGSTAVVIEPAQASEIAPIILEACDLGPREQEITRLIARGLSTTQIAERLCISPHTVRDYVKTIFWKVGVSSRGELVARVFAEHYAEPLREPIRASS